MSSATGQPAEDAWRRTDEAWRGTADEVAAGLATDPRQGLTSEEAAGRRHRSGPNLLATRPPVPWWRRLLRQFADPLVYLLLVAVAISLVAWAAEGRHGVPLDALVIAVIVVANALLGFVQEARAERAVADLQRMAAPTSTVVRDGTEREVPAAEVVPGDVLVLAEGEAVSADGRLVEAVGLTIAEAALTGESQPEIKDPAPLSGRVPLGDRVNMVFSGTAVTSGRGRALVTATGMATEMGQVARLLAETPEERTPLQREIARAGRVLGLIVIVTAVVVVGAILLTDRVTTASALVDVLLIGVSLAVAAVPEGLPAILSVVLAIGVQRMARRNAVVKKLPSVETLGSATVICADKTGTLTRNEMTIQRVLTAAGEAELTGTGFQPEGEVRTDGRVVAKDARGAGDTGNAGGAGDAGGAGEIGGDRDGERDLVGEVSVVLGGGTLANNGQLRRLDDGTLEVRGDPTDVAFLAAGAKIPSLPRRRAERFQRVGEVPFTSERKLMTSLERDADRGGRLVVVTKGAPDVLLTRCAGERAGGQARPLTEPRRREIHADVERLAGEGFRTLAVAYRPLETDACPDDLEGLERELVFAGVVGILDPPRPEARPAVEQARDAGVRVIMITGDHPRTAAGIAASLGIVPPGEPGVTGNDLDGLDQDGLRRVIRERSVFARVTPEHKLRLIEALKADGNIVAMTGDGVNDAPALKAADIGIAMGQSGTDVARDAAPMILADDNFATIVSAVREGRSIFDNIRTFIRYLLSSNLGEVLTMLLGIVLAGFIGLDQAGGEIAVPLLATQILWINLLTDTGPALAMGLEAPSEQAMDRPPRRLTDRVIDAAMQRHVVFVGFVMAVVTLATLDIYLPGGTVEGTDDLTTARTAAFTTLVLAQLFNCFNARSGYRSAFHRLFTNRLLWVAIAGSLALQVALVNLPVVNEAFSLAPLRLDQWAVCTALASVVLWADELRKLVLRLGRSRGRPPGRGSDRGSDRGPDRALDRSPDHGSGR